LRVLSGDTFGCNAPGVPTRVHTQLIDDPWPDMRKTAAGIDRARFVSINRGEDLDIRGELWPGEARKRRETPKLYIHFGMLPITR
jgi:hypothetical protein